MTVFPRVQIHQYNDSEILEFFNEHRVRYRLVGDHLFIIRSHGHELPAGPGDWLTTAADGEVEVQQGDYARRARRAIERARRGPESQTERWKRRVEAEARDRLKHNIRHVADRA